MRIRILYAAAVSFIFLHSPELASAQFFGKSPRPTVCTQQYDPVCAVKNGMRSTYSNALHGESRWRPRGLKWRLSTRAALNRRCLPKREQKGAVMGAVPGVHRLLKPVQAKPIAVAMIKTKSKIVIVKPTSMTT